MKASWRLTIFFLMAVIIDMGNVAALAGTLADVQEEAKQGGYRLITTDELQGIIMRDPAAVMLVDTRQDWEYAAGHIKGAVNFPMEPTWLARLTKRGELEQFLGPDKKKKIVFY
jgi:predicted sulfurtransferase